MKVGSGEYLFRLMQWRRQRRLIAGDPLALDGRVEPHAQKLGFVHVYVAAETGETTHWLKSDVYAGEAAKREPIDTCHLAIDRFHAFLETGDARAREAFLTIVRELLDAGHTVRQGGATSFVVHHLNQVEGYAPHATPWINAMVQGWAGALFMRAHQLTGDERYADAALCAVTPFFVAVEAGGLRDTSNGGVFYEKYPFAGQTRHVLNGFMSSLLGVWDVARATGDSAARRAFDDGVASLDDALLASYDNGHTSLYHQQGHRRATPSCVFYTWVHARQLAALARITGEHRLLGWAERWRDYTHNPRHRAHSTLECIAYRQRNLLRYLAL
jgi:hypothetical protein